MNKSIIMIIVVTMLSCSVAAKEKIVYLAKGAPAPFSGILIPPKIVISWERLLVECDGQEEQLQNCLSVSEEIQEELKKNQGWGWKEFMYGIVAGLACTTAISLAR